VRKKAQKGEDEEAQAQEETQEDEAQEEEMMYARGVLSWKS